MRTSSALSPSWRRGFPRTQARQQPKQLHLGLLDDIVGRVSQALSHGQASGLAQNVLSLLQESGGIQGLAQRLQQQGLGDVMSSWIGTGANQPISAQQIINALGSDRVAALAQQAGIPPDQASTALTQLPSVDT